MKKISVLIIGSGGREHALGWKISQSPYLKKLYFAPGNAGTALLGKNVPIKQKEIKTLLNFALEKKIDLTIVGPEEPLALGIVDLFLKNHILIFGPTKKAAQLESSKVFAVKFMKKYHIPHPRSWILTSFSKAIRFIERTPLKKIVVKADGLAMGKGVFVCQTKNEAKEAIRKIMLEKIFGDAGKKIVIQEKLNGEEISLLTISDGKNYLLFPPAKDHKPVFDNDQGPNTGGMGAFVPVPWVKKELLDTIEKKVIFPTILGMKKEKNPFQGILYAGLMIVENKPYVLEFNVRFGDPETQPLMMILKNDLLPVIYDACQKKLKRHLLQFKKGSSICVVLASKGYPNQYTKGEPVAIKKELLNKNVVIFHAGTDRKGDQLIKTGGRVIGVTLYAKDLPSAYKNVYHLIGKKIVDFKDIHYRHDIGKSLAPKKDGNSSN